jgi:membrane protein implicated in regulation of membrane protease activity
MIFYTFQQWLSYMTDWGVLNKSQPQVLKESCEGRIDAELEAGKVWRVRHLATFWAARSHQPNSFQIGDYIRVVERKGLVLFIEPLDKGDSIAQ